MGSTVIKMDNKSEIMSIILKELDDYRNEIKVIKEEQVRLLDRTNFILGQLKDKKKVLDDLLSDKNQTKH